MRVTAGTLKGRRLKAPTGQNVRPTIDKVREAIFNVLAHEVPGAVVLDLFAGAGTLGIEALSRGAKSAIFVEKSSSAMRVLKENLKELQLDSQTMHMDWSAALRHLFENRQRFDLIFADPPYQMLTPAQIADAVVESRLLTPDGILIIETGAKADANLSLPVLKRRSFGQTQLIFCASGASGASEASEASGAGGPGADNVRRETYENNNGQEN